MPLGVVFAGQLRSAESQGIWTHGTPMTSGRARRPPAGVSGRDPEQSQTAGPFPVAACDWSGLRPRPRAARARPLDATRIAHEIRVLRVNPRPALPDRSGATSFTRLTDCANPQPGRSLPGKISAWKLRDGKWGMPASGRRLGAARAGTTARCHTHSA